MAKKSGKYKAAQEELIRIMDDQQTVSVKKLKRLLQTLNISIKPRETKESVEVAYLKSEIKKLDDKMSIMGEKIKDLSFQVSKGEKL